MQSQSFAPSSPFDALLQSFGTRSKGRKSTRARRVVVVVRNESGSFQTLWSRAYHFFGDNLLAWATAGRILPPRQHVVDHAAD
jgi:hypothetical protein